jgi:hypothetical protein
MLCVGFTGTRTGLTARQKTLLVETMRLLNPACVHHGDCVGADAQLHALIREQFPAIRLAIHPPTQDRYRAFCQGDELYPARPYLHRNRCIVDVTQTLIACPRTNDEEQRSGTWATVRMARRLNHPVLILSPYEIHGGPQACSQAPAYPSQKTAGQRQPPSGSGRPQRPQRGQRGP